MTIPSASQIPDELRPYLDTIADRLLSGHAAVMVGAGFSMNAATPGSRLGFLDWTQLGNCFYRRLHGRSPRPEDTYLQVPALAHQVEAAFGRPALDQMIRDAIPDLKYEPSPLHSKLLELPWSDVFTTNYDTLLERARRSVISQRYDLVLKPDDLGRSNRPRIVKLHGSLPSDGRFIVTDEDYRRYPHDFAPFVNSVHQALLENTFCLIGFSGEDPNFLQWVGWIHDKLGLRNSPRMYLVGLLNLSPSQKTLLERRNITPVDMSVCPDIGGDHYLALDRILSYLQLRRANDNRLSWPATEHDKPVLRDSSEPSVIVEHWRSQRCRYPGWVVLPEDLRVSLWLDTESYVRELPAALPPALDLDFAFELVWRLEKCLCPIFDNVAALLETTVDRYWATTAGSSLDSLFGDGDEVDTRGLTLDDIGHRCHYLLLAMMRYYREDGLSDKWEAARQKIQEVLPTLSPELAAQFHYERALSALFALNIQEFKSRLVNWPEDRALPFWSARKAGLLAEIGELSDAQRILEQSLETIRGKLNLTPTSSDYTLVSQESLVMCLLHVLRQRSLVMASNQDDTRGQLRDFRKRWHLLKQYKCDPWQEIETFQHQLRHPPTATSDFTRMPTFDIGRTVQTHHFGRNEEALTAYNFLRFSEDAGLPFRVPNFRIATKSAVGTLTRIAKYSSYWALATLVRIGDKKEVGEVFDRLSLARMDMPTVDGLIRRYLDSLRLAAADIATGDPRRQPNFGTLIASVVPEILSRLCCKSSLPCREQLVAWLLDVYRSEHRSKYEGVGHLVTRLIESSPAGERVTMVPKLLEFPILTDLGVIEQSEYPNPFDFLDLPVDLQTDASTIRDKPLESLFSMASSDQAAGRRWAVSTLGTLQSGGLLDVEEAERFAAALWSRVDVDGLPSGTNYYRFAFLSLPHPTGVEPIECFRRYVRGARFPAQESQTTTKITGEDCSLCRDIRSARNVSWSRNDLRSIIDRLVQWWDADKAHWRGVKADKAHPSIVEPLGRRLSGLVRTLAEIVARHSDSVADDGTRSDVARVANECRAYELPALRLEIAYAYMLRSKDDTALSRITDAMASSETEAVIDALEAMGMVSEYWASQTDDRDLMSLLRRASQMVRWRRGTALWATLDSVGSVVRRHPWAFVDVVESDVLLGLSRLISESSVGESSDAGFDERSGSQNVSTKLMVRRAAARLAYRLFEHYQAQGSAIPETIAAWEEVCRSDDEFLDIRSEWLAPCHEQTSTEG